MVSEQDIQNWLIDEGFFKEKIHDENANFHFIINYPQDNIIDIVQPKGKNDLIVIACATMVSPEHVDLMRGSSDNKKTDFIWDVRFSINSFSLDFDLGIENNELRQFVITDSIYYDGLTKNSLVKSIKNIFRAKVQCVWLIEKNFGSVEVSDKTDVNNMFV